MSSHRISILSDNRFFCEGVLRVLGADPTLALMAYCDGVLPRHAGADRRSMVIVDAGMKGALAECATLVAEAGPPVILVGAPDDDAWALEALSAGARGILTKMAPPEDVAKAIEVVRQEGIWACRRWLNAWLRRAAGPKATTRPDARVLECLSPRERQVFHHAATGAGNKAVAERLAISEATVKVHLTHIFKKLGVSGRAELAAAYHGLIPVVASAESSARRHGRGLRA
jgi:two-component system nitrate/nitrite response regulator NarL